MAVPGARDGLRTIAQTGAFRRKADPQIGADENFFVEGRRSPFQKERPNASAGGSPLVRGPRSRTLNSSKRENQMKRFVTALVLCMVLLGPAQAFGAAYSWDGGGGS